MRIRFLFFLLLALPISAQDSDDVIRVETEIAAFEVTVTDKSGKPVRNLKSEDFRIFEDGFSRQIDFFQPIKKEDAGRPLSVVFALDVSGSMTTEELDKLKSALQKFIERLADYNSYFAVVSFGMEVKTLQSFTNRPGQLQKAFNKLLRDEEGLSTHAYDAVDDALRLIRKKSPPFIKNRIPRRAVILITDGFPVGDTISPATVIEWANDLDTSIYAVILPSYSRIPGNPRPLLTPLEAAGLVEKTGGTSLYATDRNFEPLFKSLAEEITSSYALAFYPSEKNRRDGKFHAVKIETKKDLMVKQNRAGYKMDPK